MRTVAEPNATGLEPVVTRPQPSRTLGEHGQRLWNHVVSEYDVGDVAGIELLTQACQAVDRAEALAGHIAADGEIVRPALA